MDMIKKELEDDSNSFELSCVKVEVEEIKSELIQPNQFGMNGIQCSFSAATNEITQSIFLAFLHLHQRALPLRARNLLIGPIGMYELWHQTCIDALRDLDLHRFIIGTNAAHTTIVTQANMINAMKRALILMNDVSKKIRPASVTWANLINSDFRAVKAAFEGFLAKVRTLPQACQDQLLPHGRILSAGSPVEEMIRQYMPVEHPNLYQ